MKDSYEDILYMEYQKSKRHPQMSKRNRAAQFAPFAALRGYEDMVEYSALETEALQDRIESIEIDIL